MKGDRTPAGQHPGLTNPQVIPDNAGLQPPADADLSSFRTHIAEPRWQVVASIIFVVVVTIIWWSFLLHWL
jgi:hypothetical protein